MKWKLLFTKQAKKDAKKIEAAGLRSKVEDLLLILSEDPFQTPPRYEKPRGDLSGAFSRRVNILHRLVYQVIEEQKAVKIIRMWTRYE